VRKNDTFASMSFGCLFSSSTSLSMLLLPGISLRVSLADNCL
jgi:hypothetical protein